MVKKKKSKPSNVIEVEEEAREESNVVDMMAMLKRSLAGKHR
ncbi:MAG: hypothetical protein ABI923_12565 [bacterium]